MAEKKCTKCGEVKPVSDFCPDPRYALGVKSECRECVAAYRRARRKANPEIAKKHSEDALARYRRAMQSENASELKQRKKAYDAAYRRANQEKLRHYEQAIRQRDPEQYKAIRKSYKARRRAQENNGISGPELAKWVSEQTKVCHWCEAKCPDDYHVDHYFPLSKGGKHEIENLVIACPSCNMTKQAKDPYEFAQERGRLF